MKHWECPKCGKPIATIDHPSVTAAHRCNKNVPRTHTVLRPTNRQGEPGDTNHNPQHKENTNGTR